MEITTMIGFLGTTVPAAVPCAPVGTRLRSVDAQAVVRGAGWRQAPAHLTVLPNVTDKCTGVSVSGRRRR